MSSVEIITIGDELIEGRLVDVHSAYLSDQLFQAGIQVTRHLSVGDDPDVMADTFRIAATRADAVLVCGGLGPTTDDLTAEAAARAFGRKAVLFEKALAHTRAIFAAIGRTMTSNNEKQAWLPEGSTLIKNPRGTASGFQMDEEGCRLYFLPGVPQEMHRMFNKAVLPDLKTRLPGRPIRVAQLCTFGLGESKIGSLLEGLEASSPGELLVQYRSAMPEVHVRLCLTGFVPDDPAGDLELERLVDEAAGRLGKAVFARGNDSLPKVVVDLLAARVETVATAESCTGGLLSAFLTDVPGASRVFLGGVVGYANEAKQTMLDVPEALLAAHGAVSGPVAEAMASGARARFDSTWALSVTGVAGPSGGTDEKPVGTVFVGLAGPSVRQSRKLFFPGDRERVRKFSAYVATEMLRRHLQGIGLK